MEKVASLARKGLLVLAGAFLEFVLKCAMCFGLAWVVLYVGMVIFEATPSNVRNSVAWNPQTYEHSAHFCNATPLSVGLQVVHPKHSVEYGKEFLNSLTAEDVLENISTHGFRDTLSTFYERTALNFAFDYPQVILHEVETLEPGECHTVTNEFRPGRERFFFRAWVQSRKAEDAFRRILAHANNEYVPSNNDPKVGDIRPTEWPAESASREVLFISPKKATNSRNAPNFAKNLAVPHCSPNSLGDNWTAPGKNVGSRILENDSLRFECASRIEENMFFVALELPYSRNLPMDGSFEKNVLGQVLAAMKVWGLQVNEYAAELSKHQRLREAYLRDFRQAEQNRLQFEAKWDGKVFPLVFGNLVDNNGYERRGVRLIELPSYDMYGAEQYIPSGANIVSVNGRKVFSIPNLLDAVYDHANSLDAGIEKRLLVEYEHQGEVEETRVRYFFNKHFFGSNHAGSAMFYGLLDVTLYDSAIASCAGGNTLKFVGNVVFEAVKWAGSSSNEQYNPKFDTFRYHDMTTCTWVQNQKKAIARQFNSELYSNMIYPAMIAPGGWRALGGKSLKKALKKSAKLGALSRPIATGTLEALEVITFDLATAPPETPVLRSLGTAAKPALLGFALGASSSAVMPTGKVKQ